MGTHSVSQDNDAARELWERIAAAAAAYHEENARIIQDIRPELVSTNPSSFVAPISALILASVAVPFAGSAITGVIAGFTLAATVSVLGIKTAAIFAPIGKTEMEDVEQLTGGILSLTFSTTGQVVGGKEGFKEWGRIGAILDSSYELFNGESAFLERASGPEILLGVGDIINGASDLLRKINITTTSGLLSVQRSTDAPIHTSVVEEDRFVRVNNLAAQRQAREAQARAKIAAEEQTRRAEAEKIREEGDRAKALQQAEDQRKAAEDQLARQRQAEQAQQQAFAAARDAQRLAEESTPISVRPYSSPRIQYLGQTTRTSGFHQASFSSQTSSTSSTAFSGMVAGWGNASATSPILSCGSSNSFSTGLTDFAATAADASFSETDSSSISEESPPPTAPDTTSTIQLITP